MVRGLTTPARAVLALRARVVASHWQKSMNRNRPGRAGTASAAMVRGLTTPARAVLALRARVVVSHWQKGMNRIGPAGATQEGRTLRRPHLQGTSAGHGPEGTNCIGLRNVGKPTGSNEGDHM